MIPFLIRPRIFVDELAREEADDIAEIHGTAFARAWSPDEFAALMADRAVFAFAGRRESMLGWRRLSGFVLVRVAADEAEILTIAVRTTSRGRGIGRLLMEEVLRRLYRERIASCFLEVDGENESAVGLYRSLGFETVGERKGYYAQREGRARPALVMRLQLGKRSRKDVRTP
jgi:ribosomal-protein-alanine N-acetyltransferase